MEHPFDRQNRPTAIIVGHLHELALGSMGVFNFDDTCRFGVRGFCLAVF